MLFRKKQEIAKEETKKFLRQQGQNLQTLSDTGDIFSMIWNKLSELNLEGLITKEIIEMILAEVIAENNSIQDSIILDPFTITQFENYVKKKNYESPDRILRANLRFLEGVRSLEDDIDFIEHNCYGYVPITEDDEILDQSEDVLYSIHNAQIQEELPVNLHEHLEDLVENDLDTLEDILGDEFSEIDGFQWETNQMA